MKIGATCPYFGGKRTLAPTIVGQLGPHRSYWEPFMGSLAVLLAKAPAAYETANDLHRDTYNLARVLQVEALAQDLYGRCARTLFHERLCRDARAHLETPLGLGPPDVDRAYAYLVFSWFGVNGVAGTPLQKTGTFCVRYTSKGGSPSTRWRSVTDSIPDWHARLLRVQLLCRDALALVEQVEDADGTVVYLDPPYVTKGARYLHDFRSIGDDAAFARAAAAALAGGDDDPPDDHVRLAARVRRFKRTRVVVSYYDHPRVRQLYKGWSLYECPTAKGLVQSGKRDRRGRTEAAEVLLVNGPAMGHLPECEPRAGEVA